MNFFLNNVGKEYEYFRLFLKNLQKIEKNGEIESFSIK